MLGDSIIDFMIEARQIRARFRIGGSIIPPAEHFIDNKTGELLNPVIGTFHARRRAQKCEEFDKIASFIDKRRAACCVSKG